MPASDDDDHNDHLYIYYRSPQSVVGSRIRERGVRVCLCEGKYVRGPL